MDNSNGNQISIKHSESLYFINGDIVLLSLLKDNVITAFKVDRVLLLRASPVFEGMLSLPPSVNVETYDNVPLVKLHDEADHLTMFLKALYDPRCIPWKKHEMDTVRIVEGILVLANKYEAEFLRERIVSLLERDWPSELTYWDINEGETNAKENSGEFGEGDLIPDPCEVIRLARKCNVPSILPAAFYHLSRIRGLSDSRLPDSLLKTLSKRRRGRTADFSLLSAEDFRCLLIGRDATLHLFDGYLNSGVKEAQKRHSGPDIGICWQSLCALKDELRLEALQYGSDPLTLMDRDENMITQDYRARPGLVNACIVTHVGHGILHNTSSNHCFEPNFPISKHQIPDMTLGTIKNSKEIYFSNGDIVLLSLPNNGVITAFKVDRVLLLRASSVFEGMFSLPPAADVEKYDGVPSVTLYDEARDLTMFLKALYDPRHKLGLETTFTVEGVLLLANKYQADYLRERIVGLMEDDWPIKLCHWDMNEAEINSKVDSCEFVREELIPEPCGVIRFARKCNVPTILPALFYHLSRIRATSDRNLPNLLQDSLREDGDDITAEFSLLSAEDYRRLAVGRGMILDAFRSYLWGALIEARSYEHSSSDSTKCGQGLSKLADTLELEVLRYHNDPLSSMKRERDAPIPDTCFPCRNIFMQSLMCKREALWKELPFFFMLETEG